MVPLPIRVCAPIQLPLSAVLGSILNRERAPIQLPINREKAF